MIKTIEQAVETLNRFKWRGRDDWTITPWMAGMAVVLPLTYQGKVTQAASHVLEDAIEIANSLELREAVEPFVKVGKLVAELMTKAVMNPHLDFEDLIESAQPVASDWARLAEVGGEK